MNEYAFVPGRRWRFDAAWPAQRVAVEVDGGIWRMGRHVRGAGYERDCEKLNTAAAQGWLVLRVTPQMIERNPEQIIVWLRAALDRCGGNNRAGDD